MREPTRLGTSMKKKMKKKEIGERRVRARTVYLNTPRPSVRQLLEVPFIRLINCFFFLCLSLSTYNQITRIAIVHSINDIVSVRFIVSCREIRACSITWHSLFFSHLFFISTSFWFFYKWLSFKLSSFEFPSVSASLQLSSVLTSTSISMESKIIHWESK